MDPPPELPGFYYDISRGKYFRILPNHLAPQGGSFYTRTAVDTLQAEQDLKSREKIATEAKASRDSYYRHRHRYCQNPFLRQTLFRELGTAGSSEQVCEAVRESYARSLGRAASLRLDISADSIRCFTVAQGVYENGGAWDRWRCPREDISEDERVDCMLVVVGTGAGVVRLSPYAIDKKDGHLHVSGDRGVDIHAMEDAITSLTISLSGQLLVTSLGASNLSTVAYNHLPGTIACLRPQHTKYDPLFAPEFSRSTFCSASDYHHKQLAKEVGFAVGTSTNVSVISRCWGGITASSYPVSDVFSVAFLHESVPKGISHLLSGARDGGIRIHSDHHCDKVIINHGSIVSHIRPLPLSPHLLLAKGPQKCALYDLRYPHPASPSPNFSKPTRAVMVYEDLSNPQGYRIDEGWDVSHDGAVMAAAVEHGPHKGEIGLWSVSTGRRLRFAKAAGETGKEGEMQGGAREDGDGDGLGATGGWYRSGQQQVTGTGVGGLARRLAPTCDAQDILAKEKEGRWIVPQISKCIKFVEIPGAGEEVWAAVGRRIERFGPRFAEAV